MAPRSGTGFINFQDFLSANSGSAQRAANQLAQGVDWSGSTAREGLQMAQEDFDRNRQAGTLSYNPSGMTADQMLERGGMGYSGPSSLMDTEAYQNTAGEAAKASRNANLLADEYGRQALLQDTFGKGNPGYSGGQQRLDSALIGAAGQGRFDQLRKDYGGLMGDYSKAISNSYQQAQQARTGSQQAAQQYAETGAEYRGRQQQKDTMLAEREKAQAEQRARTEQNQRDFDNTLKFRDRKRWAGQKLGNWGGSFGGY
jgi:hypothetical protein